MKGDFSGFEFEPLNNVVGVLHQQGRGLTDQDWNSAEVISAVQRKFHARDSIGPSVAAVPVEARDSFNISLAEADLTSVTITLESGRLWVNGSMINANWSSLPQPASYLEPPLHATIVDTSTIAENVRDAVILEVWPESVNAFQYPTEMLEPALGGVDTTERTKLYHRLRLLRLESGDDCGNLSDKLATDFSSKGALTVTAETVTVTGDCPVEAGGGYTGFEHYLIRVEVADPDASGPRFKWSRFNGGLVGRGIKSVTEDKISIQANSQMINHCGLTGFYLEALQENTTTGIWEITFSADVTLSADSELDLTNISGTWPGGDGNEAFFRLWDGTDSTGNFPVDANPNELALGLQLQFEAASADNSNFIPGDYWTFPVRASGAVGFDASSVWPNAAAPQGIQYQRVPLGVITWDSVVPSTAVAPEQIHDCRHVFRPLAQLDNCCSYVVGDGVVSHGDFDSIQAAIDALPAAGGEVCVLEGNYSENVLIEKSHVVIHGCGEGAHLTAETSAPAIHIFDASHIKVHNMQVTAQNSGVGILIGENTQTPKHIRLEKLTVNAAQRSAIEADAGQHISIISNNVQMQDVSSNYHAVFVIADDVLIEHNEIQVALTDDSTSFAAAGRGGLHIGGTSERVRVIDNLVKSGIGNGITLGSLIDVSDDADLNDDPIGWVVSKDDPCDPCAPGSTYFPPNDGTSDGPIYQSAGALYDIHIERNRIHNFGLNGIGVVAFFNLDTEDEFISVNGLNVLGNSIQNCLARELEQTPDEMIKAMGYGGISLADAENLMIQDNSIENNGFDHLQPCCGIYLLHGEGVDISRNRILNNGAKTDQSAEDANQGSRAGIWIEFASAPKLTVEIFNEIYPRQNGVPAVKVHDNIVTQPLGRALSINALGPVSVLDNQLTSQGFVFDASAPSFFTATVFIFNMGISNELYLQQILFSGETLDDAPGPVTTDDDDDFYVIPQTGLDTQRLFGYLGNGNVQCNDNQIMLDLTDKTGFQLGITSIAIVTLDDVSFQDNQCDISNDILLDEIFLMQTLVLGWTTRVTGNRFKESILGALLSGITIGLFANTTVLNQATHCLRAFNLIGSGNLTARPNAIIFDIFGVCPDDREKKDDIGESISEWSQVRTQLVLTLLN